MIFSHSRDARARAAARTAEALPIVVINLDRRADRLEATAAELQKVDFLSHERFSAFETPDGRVGCSQSHIAVLEDFVESGRAVLMVCEDDVNFVEPGAILRETLKEFFQDPVLDILCVGNNVQQEPVKWSSLLSLSSDTQTTSCYVVKRQAAKVLLRNFRRGEARLRKSGQYSRFAIDIYWKRLQRGRLVFCVPSKRLVMQRPSFSDIEKVWVDYEV